MRFTIIMTFVAIENGLHRNARSGCFWLFFFSTRHWHWTESTDRVRETPTLDKWGESPAAELRLLFISLYSLHGYEHNIRTLLRRPGLLT